MIFGLTLGSYGVTPGVVCRLAVPSPVNNRQHAHKGSEQYNVALALFRAECRGTRAGCSGAPRSTTMPLLQVEVGQNLPKRAGRTESEHVLWQRVRTITTKRSPILRSTRREKSPTEPRVRIQSAPPASLRFEAFSGKVRKPRACRGDAHGPSAPENAQMVNRVRSLRFSLCRRVIRCRCRCLANAASAASGHEPAISRARRQEARASDRRKALA
jgi:hypothetical protein